MWWFVRLLFVSCLLTWVSCDKDERTLLTNNITSHIVSLLPILTPISDTVKNQACRNDSLMFLEQLANFKLWAVQMLDSSTKLPDGVLAGSTVQLGHFDECLSVGVTLPESQRKLKGQYCLAKIEYSPKYLVAQPKEATVDSFNTSTWHHIKSFNLDRRKSRRDSLRWAICIPNSCRAEDLRDSLNVALDNVRQTFDLDIVVNVPDNYCQVGEDELDFSWIGPAEIIVGSTIAIFSILVGISTFYDLLNIDKDKRLQGTPGKFLSCFSGTETIKSLLKVDDTKDIIVVHVARFFSMVVILMGHRFIANSSAPTFNANFMELAVGNPIFIHLLISPVLVVDSFFLISGFLTGNQMLRDLDTRRFKLLSGYIHRYIRLTPVYILVVGFYATILFHIGSGPLWNARVSIEADRCAANWWTNLLYLNNYFHTDKLCMFQSWHVTCDFHFYLMSPPIVWLLLKKPKLGVAMVVTLIVVIAGTIFGLTYVNALDPVLMSFNSVMVDLSADPTFRITYIPTHTRFIPYLIGLLTSYVYYKKKYHEKIDLKYGIFVTIAVLHIPILTALMFYNHGYEYNVWIASLYASLHRIPWSIGIALLIITVITKNGWIFQPVLTWKGFVPLSRLTYCVFLCHGAVQLYTVGSMRTPDYIDQGKIFWTLAGDILSTYLIALVMHVLFEAPVLRLDRNFLSSSDKKTTIEQPLKAESSRSGEVNHGYETDKSISNASSVYSISDLPHEKYSDRHNRYLQTEECKSCL